MLGNVRSWGASRVDKNPILGARLWLRVPSHAQFKVHVIIDRVLHHLWPGHLKGNLLHHEPAWPLRPVQGPSLGAGMHRRTVGTYRRRCLLCGGATLGALTAQGGPPDSISACLQGASKDRATKMGF